jgi:hypothetical protein
MKYDLIIVALWAIAIAATFLIVHETRLITFLGPLYAICMIGSVIAMRAARMAASKPAA